MKLLPRARTSYFLAFLSLYGCAAPAATRAVVYDPTAATPLSTGATPAFIEGPVDLTVTLNNGNPFCYQYAAKVATAAFHPANPLITPAGAAAAGAIVATYNAPADCKAKSGDALLQCAMDGMETAQDNLQSAQEVAAQIERHLNNAWEACAGVGPDAGDVSKQRRSILDAGKGVDDNLKLWADCLASATTAANAIGRAAALLSQEDATATQALTTAKTNQAAGKAKGIPASEMAKLDAAVAKAQEAVNVADLLAKAASSLSADSLLKLQATVQTSTDTARSDVSAALSLIGPVGKAAVSALANQHIDVNQSISVEVTQTRLVNGKVPDKAVPESLGVANFYTLRPIWLDAGMGPH